MFNFIKKILSDKKDDNFYLQELKELSNGLGEYSNLESLNNELIKKGNELLNKIEDIEKNISASSNSEIFYFLAIAYRNFSKWYKRGDEQKPYLSKCINYLNKSLELSNKNIKAKEELGRLLIEEKQIRDLEKGILILNDLNVRNELSSHLNSTLSKALRQTNKINSIDKTYNYCKFKDPSPAVFREERVLFRKIIKQLKKENNIKELEFVLNKYYNLAVLVTLCYGNFDCNSGTTGKKYDDAIIIVEKNCKSLNYTFQENGYLLESSFISKNDWKDFNYVFGESTKTLLIK